ncbi:MAG: hypothetical protein IJ094_00495 [Bacilli bacterium]|nr:hypothetical protein [Bacilli bacterium]
MKSKKGISLIVLIITIIVVIILAAIIIISMSKNNPIEKAREAKFKSEVAQFKEELLMTHANNLADNNKYKSEKVNVDAGNYSGMKEYIPDITEEYANILYIKNGELMYVNAGNDDYDENESNWADEIGIKTGGKAPSEWSKYITYLTEDGVPIPKGFSYVTGTKETGTVIKDSSNNEFVWVPASSSTYKKDFSFPSNYSASSSNTSDDTLPTGITDESADVLKYGGFYIGRYEATTPDGTEATKTDENGLPTCQKGKVVWDGLEYSKAKERAEKMYTGSNSPIQSGLLTGTAWDTTCKWIEDYVETIDNSSLTKSNFYGNYSYYFERDGRKMAYIGEERVSGYSESWKTKNIYDLAGNYFEKTSEISSSNCIVRGGVFNEDGNSLPVSYRISDSANNMELYLYGFRVRLYIKTN